MKILFGDSVVAIYDFFCDSAVDDVPIVTYLVKWFFWCREDH